MACEMLLIRNQLKTNREMIDFTTETQRTRREARIRSADYTDYADFGFELRRAGRNERKLLS